jgi:hypothetical protein
VCDFIFAAFRPLISLSIGTTTTTKVAKMYLNSKLNDNIAGHFINEEYETWLGGS